MPADIVEAILGFIRHPSPITDAAENVLGGPPISIRQWARDHATSYLW